MIKHSPVQLLQRHFPLTLHSYKHFINDINEEMLVKILAYNCWPNVRTLIQYHIRHVKILLSLLYYLNIFVPYCYQRVNIFFSGIPVHTGVNLVHFKGAHLDPDETYKMKLTCWPWWTWKCLLEHKSNWCKMVISEILAIIANIHALEIFVKNQWSL